MRPFTDTSRFARWLLCVPALLVIGGGCAQTYPSNLVVYNAHVWTGDPDHPEADAFVVRNGEFVFVGSSSEAKTQAGDTRLIDAEGRRIVPGLIDAHLHLLGGGRQLARLDLRPVANRAAFVDAIANAADTQRAHHEWLLGGRWSTESWPDPTQPDRSWIDEATVGVPVLLHRMDGHAALANSVALARAGIDAAGPADPAGGRIERDPRTGEPTGILKESAIELVARFIPPASDAALDDAVQRATAHALEHGITCVDTMEDWTAFEAFDRARRRGTLRLRIRQFLSEPDWFAMLPRVESARADDRLRIVGFKEYADGSLGSRTAYMASPYADAVNGNRGLLREAMLDQERFRRMCDVVMQAGYIPAVHAIGDEANHEVLDVYAAVKAKRSTSVPLIVNKSHSWLAPRIEHAQHLLPGDIARFGTIPVVASMQPYHKADDGRYAELAIGAERCRTSYAFRSLIDAGTLVCFGSDWPVVTLNPFMGIHSAVTGKTIDGKVFGAEQNIRVAEALAAYTRSAARAAGDTRVGRIAKGMLADFVILDRDILTVPHDAIADTRVLATYVGGEKQFGRSGATGTRSQHSSGTDD